MNEVRNKVASASRCGRSALPRGALMIVTLAGWGLGSAVHADEQAARAHYTAAVERAEADYDVAKSRCDQLSGNPQDICIAAAKRDRDTRKAQAEASYRPNVDNIVGEMETKADGDYKVAKQKCDARTGNDKDVCLKEAEAAHVQAVSTAKAQGKAADAQINAAEEIRDADYDVAKERCDSYSGDRKDACIAEAKASYEK